MTGAGASLAAGSCGVELRALEVDGTWTRIFESRAIAGAFGAVRVESAERGTSTLAVARLFKIRVSALLEESILLLLEVCAHRRGTPLLG